MNKQIMVLLLSLSFSIYYCSLSLYAHEGPSPDIIYLENSPTSDSLGENEGIKATLVIGVAAGLVLTAIGAVTVTATSGPYTVLIASGPTLNDIDTDQEETSDEALDYAL